jgi:hypothetical protein
MGEKNPTEEKRMTWRGRIKKQGKRKSRTITPERYLSHSQKQRKRKEKEKQVAKPPIQQTWPRR